jgi:hypothetical protein
VPHETLLIDEHLPALVGGYQTLEYMSQVGWRFAIVPADEGLFELTHVMIVGNRDGWPEIRATAPSVDDGELDGEPFEGAASLIWRQAWHTLGRAAVLPFDARFAA